MRLLRNILLILLPLLVNSNVRAQYISNCEAIPYPCPVLCAGGTLFLRVFQVNDLPIGSELQVELSNAAGSFASGTQLLSVAYSSIDNGGNWSPGAYLFTANIGNLMIGVIIPSSTPGGNAYKVRLRSSSGYLSPELFNCGAGNQFTINAFVPPLPMVAQNTVGTNQWIGHVYTWTPTVPGVLSIPQVAQQMFFLPFNYRGHVVYNALSFDINHYFWGFIPGTVNNGTSISCENTLYQNFAIRLLRNEDFEPGRYRFTIAGDDGVRVSVDGGATWLVNSWAEQGYGPSLRTSDNDYPNGVCLSGPTNLVYEYFQRPQESRMTLQITQLESFETSQQPLDLNLCEGENGLFSVGNGPNGMLFQWQMSQNGGSSFTNINNSSAFNGASSPTLNLVNVNSNLDGAIFQCQLTDPCGVVSFSESALLNVSNTPQFTLQPEDAILCANQNIQFTSALSGDVNSYQWQVSVNGGTSFSNISNNGLYSGSTTAQLTLNNAPSTFNGYIFQLVANGCSGSVTSQQAVISVAQPMSINLQPQDIVVCQGEQVIFSISATGANTYQWQINTGAEFENISNGQNITGASSNSLTINAAGLPLDGNLYQCVIDDGCGNLLTTQTASLTVNPGSSIILQPNDITACEGDNVTFEVDASGNVLSYQWQLSTNGGSTFTNLTNGTTYNGSNSSTLGVNNISASDNGSIFQCVIQGICGNAFQSNSVSLSVSETPSFITQPLDQVFCPGQNISFNTEIEGSALNYQWQISSNSGATFSDLIENPTYNGTNAEDLNILNPSNNLNGSIYQLILTGCGGVLVSSDEAILTAGQELVIDNQPQNIEACEGDDFSFEVGAFGADTYQWQLNSGSGFSNITEGNGFSGTQINLLTINNANISLDGTQVICQLSGPCSNGLSSTIATIQLNSLTTIIQQPQDLEICEGMSGEFNVSALGSNLTYQWQISSDNGANFSDFSNYPEFTASTNSLSIINAGLNSNNLIIQCIVSGDCGNPITSQTVDLTVNTIPSFTQQPIDIESCIGTSVVFQAELNTNANIQWQSSSDGGLTFSDLPETYPYIGTNTNTLTINDLSTQQNGQVLQMVVDGCGTNIVSFPVNLAVLPFPEILSYYPPEPVCPGENTSMEITSINATSYQWQINENGIWTDILNNAYFSGAQDSLLQLNDVSESLNGNLFRCIASGNCDPEAISEAITLELKGFPEIVSSPLPSTVCSGIEMQFPVVVKGLGIDYQWQSAILGDEFTDLENDEIFSSTNYSTLTVQGVNEVNELFIRCVIEGCGKIERTLPIKITILQNNPVYIPNAFSPDGDYVNPIFKIYTEGEPVIDASIYNRWGELVYSWTSKEDGWDGTFLNAPVQEGVYVYRIKVTTECDEINQTGSLTLFR